MFANLRNVTPSKTTVTRLFITAIAFGVAGSALGIVVVISALANGAVTIGGSQPVAISPGPIAGAIAGLAVASLLTGIGTVAALASWAAALRNTWQLEDRSWFVGLLSLGLVSFGWLALVAYILRGPDATRPAATAA
jgi:hypothetical protein